MNHIPQEIAEIQATRPNLWRLACELSECKDPYKVLDIMAVIAGPILRQEKEGAAS